MPETRAPQLTTVELIDALEARIASFRTETGRDSGDAAPVTAALLRAEMSRAAVAAPDLARAVGLPCGELDACMNGGRPVPSWLLAATRLFALLTPSARRKLLTRPRAGAEFPDRTHPFSRIEEL